MQVNGGNRKSLVKFINFLNLNLDFLSEQFLARTVKIDVDKFDLLNGAKLIKNLLFFIICGKVSRREKSINDVDVTKKSYSKDETYLYN